MRMKHLLLFICFWAIYPPSVVRAEDGCKDINHIRCGDKCGDECSCGNHSFGRTDFYSWCCTNDTCTVTGEVWNEHDKRYTTLVTCPSGSNQSLSSPCNGRCNHWIEDGYRNRRSSVLCLSEKQCVNEMNMCHGDALCDDQSDLRICQNENMWSEMPCPFDQVFTRCKGAIPGQCIYSHNIGDEEYNCNDRSDEEPYETKNESVIMMNMAALISCKHDYFGNGLKCGEECVPYYAWCNTKPDLISIYICPELNNATSTNKELCSNVTFWETQECGTDFNGAVGVRCTGRRSGQCVFPNTTDPLFSKSCHDKSDQKHQINSTCPPIDHTTSRNTTCDSYCRYGSQSACNECLTSDPQNCRGSCNTTDPSCDSCTNPSYFYCNRSGECFHPDLRCDLHPQCRYGEDEQNCLEKYREKDLVPQHATYKCQSPHYHQNKNKAKKISRDKTSRKEITVFIEESGQHVNIRNEGKSVAVEILSVRCNQVRECHNNLDEDGCDNDISPVKVLLVLFSLLAASFALLICLRYCENKSESQRSQVESIELEGAYANAISLLDQIKQTNIAEEDDLNRIKYIIEDYHSRSTGFEVVNMSLTTLQIMNVTQEFKKSINSFYFGIEMEIHKGSKAETLVCMKQHLNSDIAKIILNDAELDSQVALLRWSKTKLAAAKEFVNKNGSIWHFFKMSKKIVTVYLDIIKDIVLTISLIGVVSFDSIIDYPTFLACQLVWMIISTILVPILTFGIQVASSHPYIIFGMEGQKKYKKNPMGAGKLLFLRTLIVLFGILVPAVLICIEERINEDTRNLIREGKMNKKTIRKFEDQKKFVNDVSKLIIEYKRHEFTFEIFLQIMIQTGMVLMNHTNTNTAKTYFKEKLHSEPTGTIDKLNYEIKKSLGTKTFLVLSILWSFKTIVTTYIKIKSSKKGGFFPTKAKIVLGVRTLICTITRLSCMVVYFTPFLGFFNLMAHWKSELISFSPFKYGYCNETFSCWNDDIQKVQNIPYSLLYRSGYCDGSRAATPPSYISYTTIKIDMAYLMFWIIMIFQMILLLCSNMCFNQKFRAGTKTYKMRHILQTLHVPDTASDWDEIEGSVMEHRRQWRKTIMEFSIMVLIQFMINLSLLWPILVTGFKIRERHEFIKPCIGVFLEEEVAYQKINILMWSLPGLVFLSSFLDWILVFIYQKKCHPWVGILKDEQFTEDKDNVDLRTPDDKCSQDVQELHTNSVEDVDHPDPQIVNECQETSTDDQFAENGDYLNHNNCHEASSFEEDQHPETNEEVTTSDTREPVQEESFTAEDELPSEVRDMIVDPAVLCNELIQEIIDKMEVSESD